MKLTELYILSFIEPIDVIESFENGDIIRKLKERENLPIGTRRMAEETGLPTNTVGRLLNLKKRIDNGEPAQSLLINKRRRGKATDEDIIRLVEGGNGILGIARQLGISPETARNRLRILGYTYNKRVYKWERPQPFSLWKNNMHQPQNKEFIYL